MHLIDIDVIGVEAPQRVGRLTQDPVAARIAMDFTVLPLEPHLCCDHDVRAQPRVGKRVADDFFGAAKTIGGCGVDQGDAAFNGGADCLDRLLLVSAAPHPAADRPGAETNA